MAIMQKEFEVSLMQHMMGKDRIIEKLEQDLREAQRLID